MLLAAKPFLLMLPTCSSWHDRLWTPRKGMQGQTDRQTIKSCMSMLYTKYRFWARVQWIYMVGEWQVFTRQWQVVCVFAKNWKRIVCFPRGLTDKKMCRTCRWYVNHIMYSIMYYNTICLELRTWEVEFRSQTLDLAISNFLGLLILGFRIQNLELRIWSWSPRS